MICTVVLLITCLAHSGVCWTTEDLELFDLVENTPQTFYAVLGVDEKASPSEIRKAYRRLSTLYHPDKSTEPDAEIKFRQIAAVADVLRNEERRKAYDYVLKAGLPDWRTPIYYYRQLRNIGILEIGIFLFILATVAQYLFAWSSYWEKKYEIEEVFLSKYRKKSKNQRKGKYSKEEEEAIFSEVMSTLQKPRYQDLFPLRLLYFMIHLIKSSPSYIASCGELLRHRKEVSESESEDETQTETPYVRYRKPVKPNIPEYTEDSNYIKTSHSTVKLAVEDLDDTNNVKVSKWSTEALTENQLADFKKALKKFPIGTLQRWDKVAAHLGCNVSDVTCVVKSMKNQQFSKGIPISMQGLTGVEKENLGCELYEEKDACGRAERGSIGNFSADLADSSQQSNESSKLSETIWKQEEQQSLELALREFPKDTPARWEKISEFVSTKTKEECLVRYKILVQQVKKKKDKSS